MTKQDRTIKAKGKRLRRAQRQQQAAAVAADIWQPRPDSGKDRPTPERRAKGAFVLRETEDAGVTFAVDTAATMLDRLTVRGLLSADQCQAGHDYAALMERTRLVSQGRSCLNFEPVGHDSDAEPTHGELRDIQERRELYLACGVLTWAVLQRTCVDQQMPADLIRLREGLDICVKMWKGT